MIVVLVHGLGRTPLSLFGLAAALRQAGHCTRFFGYSPTFEPLARIVRRLTERLRALAKPGRPVGLVGHSLGGLLLRMAIPLVPELSIHHLVMLGTPNRPPRAARWAWRLPPFRWLTRDCGRFLADMAAGRQLPLPSVPYTLVAGTAGPSGPWSPFGGNTNDGIVAVEEVPIHDADPVIRLPVWHSVMMYDARVKAAVVTAMMSPPDNSGG